MAKTAKRQTGDLGEGVVCRWLESRGYKVLERNYLKPWGEIDIVAERAKKLYFIEVKSARLDSTSSARRASRESASRQIHPEARSKGERYRPEENVHPAKLKRLHRAVQTYLLDRKVPENKEWQIDVACVYLDFSARKARVEVLENVML